MAMTSAERQARYRKRVKAQSAAERERLKALIRAPGETAEATIERVRQGLLVDWFQEARDSAEYRDAEDVERELAFLARVAARPLWRREGFEEWLERLVAYDIERDVTEARKAEKREASARRKRRAAGRTAHGAA